MHTEICLDCKDKLIKFYHFKRKAKEIQKKKLQANRVRTSRKEKHSKVVQNIVQIVENYTEKCSISSIRVDEINKKLIIEPQGTDNVEQSNDSVLPVIIPHKSELPFEPDYASESSLNAVIIKQEPGLDLEESNYIDDDSMTFNDGTEHDDDDKDYSAGEASHHYYGGGDSSEAGTSTGRRTTQKRRSRSQPNEGKSNKVNLILFSKYDFCID